MGPSSGFQRGLAHDLNRGFKDFLAFHFERMETLLDGLLGCRDSASTGWDFQKIRFVAVSCHKRRKNLVVSFSDRPNDGRPSAVTEKNTGAPVFPIDKGGQFFCTDEEDMLIGAAFHKSPRHIQTINKTRASRRQVKSGRLGCPQFAL